MTLTANNPLTLSEARSIAESILGHIEWQGARGYCRCPGIELHTTANARTDCKVICEPVAIGDSTLKPGVYCFHDSCRVAVEAARFALCSALGKRSPSIHAKARIHSLPVKKADPTFDPVKLERLARKLAGADAEWFAARSRKRVDNRTSASFLHELYRPGEKIVIFDVFESQGQALWTHRAPPFDARELDDFGHGKPCGVWFLSNPVTGDYAENDDGKQSRRSWQNVTSFRYMVLESDKADPVHWLSAVAQMPLPISAIYDSAGKSIHALVKINAESKAHWDSEAARRKPVLITLGADRKTLSAVRLTRLPCCERLGKRNAAGDYVRFSAPQMQRLIYLNGAPDETPICELEAN